MTKSFVIAKIKREATIKFNKCWQLPLDTKLAYVHRKINRIVLRMCRLADFEIGAQVPRCPGAQVLKCSSA